MSTHEEQAAISARLAAIAGNRADVVREAPAEAEPEELPRALFGYDRSTTVDLLATLREQIRSLVTERAVHEQRIADLEAAKTRADENQRLIGETLVAAAEEAEKIREEARRDALKLVRAAESESAQIREDAERAGDAKATELVAAAEVQRRDVLERTRREQQGLLEEARRAKAFVDETQDQLAEFLAAALRWHEQSKRSSNGFDVPPATAGGESAAPTTPD